MYRLTSVAAADDKLANSNRPSAWRRVVFGSIFDPAPQVDAVVQAGPIADALGTHILDSKNKFFDPALGTNGQACVTCHQPADGFDIHVTSIQNAFAATGGTDPLFRCNDTADNPFTCNPSSPSISTYNLFYNLGVIRFARPASVAGQDFTIAPQNTAQFGPQPHLPDPQNATAQTISVFRRPLINLNVRFDSSVLWDGRESITDLRTQVHKAAKSLLLANLLPAHDISDNDADDVAAFMLGVSTSNIFNTSVNAGDESAAGAKGGLQNLLALASDPNQPCRFDASHNLTASLTPPLGQLTPPTCTPVILNNPHTMNLFDAWASLPSDNATDIGRLSVARGQALFNTKDLIVPPDLISQLGSQNIHCITCHATNNLGNNPDATFFTRIGTDSVAILTGLVASPSTSDPASLQDTLNRIAALPQYCLRPNTDSTPFSTAACGTHVTDVTTADPGRATVSGKIADVGRFKPPILRNFSSRAPYFHAGAAKEDDDLINFYNARFQIGLTDQEHNDLIAFLNSF
jgi:hypothetical protein